MIPFFVLVSSFAAFVLIGRWVEWLSPWPIALRLALALMFAITASAHWGSQRPDLVKMVSDLFPNPELLVTLTGLAEIVGAVGLLLPTTASAAATGLAILMVAMFPANILAAAEGMSIGGSPVTPLVGTTALDDHPKHGWMSSLILVENAIQWMRGVRGYMTYPYYLPQ